MAQGVEKPTIRSRHTSISVRSDAGGDSASGSEAVSSKDPLNSYSFQNFEGVGLVPNGRLIFLTDDEYCVQFYYGNPSVEMVKGVLHLFREK